VPPRLKSRLLSSPSQPYDTSRQRPLPHITSAFIPIRPPSATFANLVPDSPCLGPWFQPPIFLLSEMLSHVQITKFILFPHCWCVYLWCLESSQSLESLSTPGRTLGFVNPSTAADWECPAKILPVYVVCLTVHHVKATSRQRSSRCARGIRVVRPTGLISSTIEFLPTATLQNDPTQLRPSAYWDLAERSFHVHYCLEALFSIDAIISRSLSVQSTSEPVGCASKEGERSVRSICSRSQG
jgi:hypothetical protein